MAWGRWARAAIIIRYHGSTAVQCARLASQNQVHHRQSSNCCMWTAALGCAMNSKYHHSPAWHCYFISKCVRTDDIYIYIYEYIHACTFTCFLTRVTIAPHSSRKQRRCLPARCICQAWHTALQAPTSAASNLLPRGRHEVPAE